MNSLECIEQKGIIKEVSNNKVMVTLTSFSSCAHCHSKSTCAISEQEEKEFEIQTNTHNLKPGEEVIIEMKKNLGLKATLLAYIAPFVLLLISLIVFTSLGFNDLFSGIISLLILIPYFLILYFRRNALKKNFSLSLRKE